MPQTHPLHTLLYKRPIRSLAVGLAVFACSTARADPAPLSVCVAENNPPLSWKAGKRHGGFDVLMAQGLAEHLGRPLKLVWFEPEYEKEAPLSVGVNALLSSGMCQLVSGYGLYEPALGEPAAATGRTPDFDGAKRKRERAPVKLGTLIASSPYMGSALTFVLGPHVKDRQIQGLSDVKDLRVGVTAGSLGGALVMMYGNGTLRSAMHSVGPTGDVLAEVEKGRADVAFGPLNRFDAYRAAHPDTALTASTYLHPLQFNLGFVALEEQRPLIDQVNAFIAAARLKGSLKGWADSAKLTYVEPGTPDVQPPMTPMTFAQYR
jgi:ABC-type amino acid transport substrate-binding protein